MPRALILVMFTSALVTVTTLVAAAAAAFFWGGTVGITGNDRASSGLMAAIYAPFALLALILPLLSAPMARLALRLGGSASGTAPFVLPPAPAWVALFAGAEAFTALARAAAGEPPFSPSLFVHALLAGYTAAAAYLLRRTPEHVRDTSTDAP